MAKRKSKLEEKTRLAIVNSDKCQPNKCGLECRKYCPQVMKGVECILVDKTSRNAQISEVLCIGCGHCIKRCPFNAIRIINLPKNLTKNSTHRFGPNSFKLHRLPTPKLGRVSGLVGANGTGKSTAIKILAGKIKPNLGNFQDPPDWADIIRNFRGSSLQNYFKKVSEGNFRAVMKPQNPSQIAAVCKGSVRELLDKDNPQVLPTVCHCLDLTHLLDRPVSALSGGELQRVAIAKVSMTQADMFIFDEMTSYLDIKQRLKAASLIRSLVSFESYVLVVEHDISILDYLSDDVTCLFGEPGAYGVVSSPSGVREGVNHFLNGFLPAENMRFRDHPIEFHVPKEIERIRKDRKQFPALNYPQMTKTYTNGFKLNVEKGAVETSEIVVLLGENGTGKSTFIKILAGQLAPDQSSIEIGKLSVSYKPQSVEIPFETTVRRLLQDRIGAVYLQPQFVSEVMKPLDVFSLLDFQTETLSGGEMQRVALTLCLGTPADLYLIDEPSAHLDSEQRLLATKAIKRFVRNEQKACFVVEHDILMALSLADGVILFRGRPGLETSASEPKDVVVGMNEFLRELDVSFHNDNRTSRPRINRPGSARDISQKRAGIFFDMETRT